MFALLLLLLLGGTMPSGLAAPHLVGPIGESVEVEDDEADIASTESGRSRWRYGFSSVMIVCALALSLE